MPHRSCLTVLQVPEAHFKRERDVGTKTTLARANLIDAHLDEAIFYNTNLRDANLCGACLRKSHRLYTASLGGIRHDAETRFPEDLTLPRHSHYLFPSDDEEE